MTFLSSMTIESMLRLVLTRKGVWMVAFSIRFQVFFSIELQLANLVIDCEKYPICRNGGRYKKDSGNSCTRSKYTESEMKDKQVKRGLIDIDVDERDNDSDMSPSKKWRL